MRLEDKVAIVTGHGSGIGAATATELAKPFWEIRREECDPLDPIGAQVVDWEPVQPLRPYVRSGETTPARIRT